MLRTEGLPDSVSITSLNLRDDAYAVLCLPCGGGAAITVQTCRGDWAKEDARAAALLHAESDARRIEAYVNGEKWAEQAAALGWSAAQADAMSAADRGHLHYDGAVYYRKDPEDPGVTRGRTVAKARVTALIRAGLLECDGRTVELTADGHAARRAWISARPEPAEQEPTALRPLIGGQEERRRAAERAAYAVEAAERAAQVRQAEPAPAVVEAADCGHALAFVYLTADPITLRLGYYLACACGENRVIYPKGSPAMPSGTARRPLGIREADTATPHGFADQRGYGVTGPWEILDEHTKRAAVTAHDDERVFPVVADSNRRPAVDEPQPAVAVAVAVAVAAVAVAAVAVEDVEDEDDDEACEYHRTQWLYVAAEQPTGRLRAYLTCACGRGPKLGNFNQRTAMLGSRSISAAPTRIAQALADRNDYEITGPWTVVDEHTKRAAVRWTREAAAVDELDNQDADQVAAAAVVEAVEADPEAERAARWAATSGVLTIDGPGIIGSGTHVTYRDGRGPGMRSKHGTAGMVVSIGRTAVKWRPYGSSRALRTPLDDMRVYVPPVSAVSEGSGPAVYWRRWSLADHLGYARRTAESAGVEASARPVLAAVPQASAGPLQLALFADDQEHAEDVEQAPAPAPTAAAAGPVVIVPCSVRKLGHRAPAGELYLGGHHSLARRAADALTAEGGTVLILSARYGLVTLDEVIEPYDLRMGEPGSITAAELRAQAARLQLDGAEDVTVLAGAVYAAAVRAIWPHAVNPLAGTRGIGEQRGRLAALARAGSLTAAA